MSRTLGDGRALLTASAFGLMLAGLVVVGLGVSGNFLPHDEAYLGMSARDLCALHECRIVHFMIHDRVSFGGSLIAIGLLYRWLVAHPLSQGQAWAWWVLLVSSGVGFASFFAYLGHGYLDTWHGLATLGLLPLHGVGLVLSHRSLRPRGVGCLLAPSVRGPWTTATGIGRACLLGAAAGMVLGGGVIFAIGMTHVFVPEDLAYMGVQVDDLARINERLVPLIAHDRAGFGGGVCCCGVALFFCLWCAVPSASLWRTLVLVGLAGFGSAIAVHPAIGYNDAFHLAPALLGAVLMTTGLILTFPPKSSPPSEETP